MSIVNTLEVVHNLTTHRQEVNLLPSLLSKRECPVNTYQSLQRHTCDPCRRLCTTLVSTGVTVTNLDGLRRVQGRSLFSSHRSQKSSFWNWTSFETGTSSTNESAVRRDLTPGPFCTRGSRRGAGRHRSPVTTTTSVPATVPKLSSTSKGRQDHYSSERTIQNRSRLTSLQTSSIPMVSKDLRGSNRLQQSPSVSMDFTNQINIPN